MKSLIFLFTFLGFCGSAQAGVFDRGPLERLVISQLGNDDTHGDMADRALDAMLWRGSYELTKAGRKDLGDKLHAEWVGVYQGVLSKQRTVGDTGDHAPVSEWIAKWYAKLEEVLGVKLMDSTHLRDIWVLNFTIPVVFAPHAEAKWCVDQLVVHPTDTCAREYLRHFGGTKWADRNDPLSTAFAHNGFAGVVTYWLVWAGCEGATWGAGTFFICGPAGALSEIAVERFAAPRLSARIWTRRNP